MENTQIKLNLRNAKVDKIVFYNPTSCWGIFRVENNSEKDVFKTPTITVAGNFEGLYERCKVNISGHVINHPKYGLQISLDDIQILHDTDSEEGIINFLTKSVIKGIHIQNARKIYNHFGNNSISVVLETPEQLSQINGIGEKTINKVKASVDIYNSMREVIDFGIKNNIQYQQMYKLYQVLKEDTIRVLTQEPYKVLDYADNFSFKQIDNIALKIGIEPNNPIRLEYGLLYVLDNLVNLASSTGCLLNKLSKEFSNTLGVQDLSILQSTLSSLVESKKIVVESGIAYNKKYYDAEKYIAERILTMVHKPLVKGVFKRSIIEEEINSFDFQLTDEQINAIKRCLIHDFSVLTSPGGCGKSTITKALVNIYKRHKFNVILLSPTGKATRRLEECAGYSAQTIHKFLKVKYSLDDAEKVIIPDNSVIIIDESSMLDIQLFAKLLESCNDSTKIILVGDNNQLPSVQAGNILGDLIESGVVNVCRLHIVMRQKNDSTILDYCNRVNSGLPIIECNNKDLFYKQYDNLNTMHDDILRAYKYEVNKQQTSRNIQVLTIYKRGILGDNNLNQELRDAVNIIDENELVFGYALNDKVMHIKNNYQKDIFNGEVGQVIAKDEDEILVDYGDKLIKYVSEDIDELQLAYSSTIHKAQGSEYPIVFIIVSNEVSNFLLIRKILYTAISRGKEKVYLFAQRGTVQQCINNDYYEERFTKLCKFLTP